MSATVHSQAGKGCRDKRAPLGRAHPLLVHGNQPTYVDQLANIIACKVHNEAMPAPNDAAKRPDFVPLIQVSEAVSSVVKPCDTVIDKTTNHVAILFNKLGIDTLDVLEAAGTKWNFLPFRPGLVGGHCISVDPYYLTHKAQEVGHHPQVILAGRRTNDGMGCYVADQVIKLMVRKGINPVRARVLLLGLAFKENCPDLRNTRVVDIVHALEGYSAQVDVYDPWVDTAEAQHEYGLTPIESPAQGVYDAIVLAVGHDEFRALGGEGVRAFGRAQASVVYDVKYVLPRDAVDGRL